MTSQTAPAIIHKLVETFEQNLDSYRSSKNEIELRREFLDKFFTALGWDVANEKGYDELGKEVIHEFSVDVAGQQKKADYAFRVGRGEKFDFLVEAKKPSVKVETSQEAAFQIRRYGWSAKLPINILTDFEHFAVYDCRTKPSYNDKASMGRIMLIHYKDYVSRWNEIVEIFSPEAVRKGSFAKYAESMKGKKGTADVDDAFLQEIERWRELLAKNIALRNETIDIAGLNYAVQMTIDRIVFLRICEERGIEPENQLLEIVNRDGVYTELCELFKRADTKYNSGLFHFKQEKELVSRPDDLTLSLEIDDKVLKDIISNLYYPKSPYAFLYIPSDILGQVYERFLGKVIRLTAGHSAKVEEKPEVRKAGGVFYTPTYIVDYIVENTVGKLVEKKSPKDVVSLKIVDPACGSGTFLLGAYQFLLDWHLNWYVENEPEKAEKNKAIIKVSDSYRLTTVKKKEILLNNIHGVDIDAQAVEVTKLSLLLKVLENASGQLGLSMERVLPDLGNNIKCGNSLIGYDYFEGQLLPSEEERIRVNPFNWKKEFPETFSHGGFDIVIGNPPWISLSGKFGAEIYPPKQIEYLVQNYHGNTYMPNMYEYFVSQGLNLVKKNGYFSFIVPDRLGFNRQFIELRKRILNESRIVSLVYKTPFPNVTADTLVFVFQKCTPEENAIVRISEHEKTVIDQKQSDLLSRSGYVFGYFDDLKTMSLIDKIESSNIKPLKDYCETTSGYGGKSKLITESQISPKQIQTLKGESIGRYVLRKIFFFEFKKENITGRTTDKNKLGATPKILLRKTGDKIIATFDETGIFPEQSLYFLFNKKDSVDYKYLLGLLNSKLLTVYYRAKSLTNKNSIAQVKKVDLDELPIHTVSASNEQVQHDKIVLLVEKMLELQKRLAKAKTPQERESLERQIQDTDSSIDSLVYDLYGLNEEEVKILEGSL
jgi:type I restriction-modification system DNA methylase subunit